MWKLKLLISVVLVPAFLLIAGCARPIAVSYIQGVDIHDLEGVSCTLGIEQFNDTRPLVEMSDAKSESYVYSSPVGIFKYGISVDGVDYMPVKQFVYNAFVNEFRNAGFNVVAINYVPQSEQAANLINIAKDEKVDYLLGGNIVSFDINNLPGFGSVGMAFEIAVVFDLSLVSASGEILFENNKFKGSSIEREGVLFFYDDNVNKLVNQIFKDVLNKVVKKVGNKLVVDCLEKN